MFVSVSQVQSVYECTFEEYAKFCYPSEEVPPDEFVFLDPTVHTPMHKTRSSRNCEKWLSDCDNRWKKWHFIVFVWYS